MRWLSDKTLQHLQTVADLPDLTRSKYRLIKKIAEGGMGSIYLVEDITLDRRIVLKVMKVPDPTGELTTRMMNEARIIARLEHPGIVPVHDVGTLPDGRIFYTMKHVQGSSLDQYIQTVHTLPERLHVFQKICEAVAFAHSYGVIHRDLKPENIMIGGFGEVLVMDWGVARMFDSNPGGQQSSGSHPPGNFEESFAGRDVTSGGPLPAASAGERPTLAGTVIGTPAYMAPEQAAGRIEEIDKCSDIYSLGAILYFLLTDEAPPPSLAPHPLARPSLKKLTEFNTRLRLKIPKAIRTVCNKAMAQHKEQRYGNALDLALDVQRFLNGLPVSSYRENPLEMLWRWVKKNKFIVILVLTYVIMRFLLYFLSRI